MDSEPLQQFGCGVPLNAGVAKVIVVRPERNLQMQSKSQDFDVIRITLSY
jgi:hypothetical protein